MSLSLEIILFFIMIPYIFINLNSFNIPCAYVFSGDEYFFAIKDYYCTFESKKYILKENYLGSYQVKEIHISIEYSLMNCPNFVFILPYIYESFGEIPNEWLGLFSEYYLDSEGNLELIETTFSLFNCIALSDKYILLHSSPFDDLNSIGIIPLAKKRKKNFLLI